MKYLFYAIIGLVAFAVLYFGVLNRQQPQSAEPAQEEWEAKTDEQGQVTIKVTPQKIIAGVQWKFDVVFDTHSVELDQDLMQIAELVDDQGNIYKPVVWEGAGPGGHHREGVLVFEAVNPDPSSVELKIKDVGGVPERSFVWSLK